MNPLILKQPEKIIHGERIILKVRDLNQAAEMYELIDRNRDHLRPWFPWENTTKTVEDSKSFITLALEWWEKKSCFDYSIYEKSSDTLIGSFGLHSINWSKRTCAFGYWLDQRQEGKGYATEATLLGEKIAADLGFHRIIITCDRSNTRSQNIPRRLGYKKEALLVDEGVGSGKMRDTLQFVKLLNPEVEGQITENLPMGFSIRDCESEEFWSLVRGPLDRIFDGAELILRPPNILSEPEKLKLKNLNENFKHPYLHHTLLLYNGELAGWTWGYQDSRESFYMVNSAVLPEHRGRGLYSRLLDVTLKKLIDMGFQRIWSRHNFTNNEIIIPKLKRGFCITGTELSDIFGSLIHLTYFSNKTRRKVLDFRSGHLRPDQELKDIFKI